MEMNIPAQTPTRLIMTLTVMVAVSASSQEMVFKSAFGEKHTTKDTLPSKALFQIPGRNQKLYRQAKAKRIWHH